MSTEHEYSLLGGANRSSVGKWIMRASALVSAGAVFVLLTAVNVAHRFGVNANLPPSVLSLVGAGMVYAALYWVFDRYGWRVGVVGKWLSLPNLSGRWRCQGLSLDRTPPQRWDGAVTIIQSWDRIRVHLETERSSSNSVAAALLHETGTGDRLLYHYRNDPRVGEADLHAHHGFAELVLRRTAAAHGANTSMAGDATPSAPYSSSGRSSHGPLNRFPPSQPHEPPEGRRPAGSRVSRPSDQPGSRWPEV